jgi:hypothetical protein
MTFDTLVSSRTQSNNSTTQTADNMPKKFNALKEIPDLHGKVILVTGGNAGIGEATVRALAAHNPTKIVLCARKTTNGDKVVETVHQLHPKAKIDVLELDLNSFDSVRKCAATFNDNNDRLDILFLNAGVASTAPQKTKEGYEYQFGGRSLLYLTATESDHADKVDSKPHGPRAPHATSSPEDVAYR